MSTALDVLDEKERRLLGRMGRLGWREPVLATLTHERFSDPGWIFERKLDGVRVLPIRDDNRTTLWSRNRKVMNNATRS